MLKTIKTTKHMRLDELIKYCIENDIEDEKFKIGGSKNKVVPKGLGFGVEKNLDYKEFRVSRSGIFMVTGDVNKDDLFQVEIEEEITEDMIFDLLVQIAEGSTGYITAPIYNSSIKSILEDETETFPTVQFYAMINGKLELVWEREEE